MPIFETTWIIVDDFKRRTRTTYKQDAVDFDEAIVNEDDMSNALSGLLGGAVIQVSTAQVTDLVDVATANSNIDEALTFQFGLGGAKTASRKTPAPLKSYLDGTGNVDLADPLVTAYTDLVVGGPFLISDEEVALAVNSGQLDK